MVFKLVRIDTQEPCKIQLTIGKHVIGRGKFLHNDDTDKRVSRNHAELEVTPDTVNLKSLHQNPCFFIKKSIETQLLHQDSMVNLCHGDKFGLLPDHFWYEVLHCPDQDIAKEQNVTSETTENGVLTEEENTMEGTDGVRGNVTPDSAAAEEENEEEAINFENGEEEADPIRSASPSLLTDEHVTAELETAHQETGGSEVSDQVTSKPGTADQVTSRTDAADQVTIKQETLDQDTETYDPPPQVPKADDGKLPPKRDHSPTESSPVDVKKVKIENVDAGDGAAGPSNGAQPLPGNNSKDNAAAPASPAKPSPPPRERCIYGANCYRRNPQHKAQFSHPSDADWGAGPQGVCPYGSACRKHDPRHWQQHEHPPGTQPPRRRGPAPGMQVVQRHGNIYYINAHSVNFYDDHFQVEDSDGDSVDYDYEF